MIDFFERIFILSTLDVKTWIMTFRRKLLWFFIALVIIALAILGLWKIGVIESLKWVNILCLVCCAIGLLLFVLMIACSRNHPHPDDIMGRAHSIEMKRRNSK